MPSLLAHVVRGVLLLSGRKGDMASETSMKKRLASERASPALEPTWMAWWRTRVVELAGAPCRTFVLEPYPAAAETTAAAAAPGIAAAAAAPRADFHPRITLVYLHGGCYTYSARTQHWDMVSYLASRLNARVVFPYYPLAPESTAPATLAAVRQVYAMAAAMAAADSSTTGQQSRLVIMGDSAGGGLSLALAQALAAEEQQSAMASSASTGDGAVGTGTAAFSSPSSSLSAASSSSPSSSAGSTTPAPSRPPPQQPSALVLIAPWLDATLSSPAVAAQAATCAMLDVEGLRAAGRWYAGEGADPALPPVSPLGPGASLAGLPPTTVIVGTNDLLLPDARALRDRWGREAGGQRLRYIEGEGMEHDYPIIHLMPEGWAAAQALAAAVEEDCLLATGAAAAAAAVSAAAATAGAAAAALQ
jgi:acetyl esterase/lipase